MNHWKTTESVTNEAEIIHFGENVYVELHSLMGSRSVISDSICMGGKELKHEVPKSGILQLPFSSQHLTPKQKIREYSTALMPLSVEFKCTNLILFVLD